MKSLIHLQTIPGIPLEKDELYRTELSDGQKLIKKIENDLKAAAFKQKQLRRLDAESRGVEPAYIDRFDLVKIIEDLLANKSPVSKAFERHEVNEGLCADWAVRTIRYSVDKLALSSAFDALATNTDLILMQKYKVLDVQEIARSASYSAALTKLKKQLDIAHRLQDKDNQLINKDSTIVEKVAEIARLNAELLKDKSEELKQRVIELQQAGISIAEIGRRVGKSRGTIYKYLNNSN